MKRQRHQGHQSELPNVGRRGKYKVILAYLMKKKNKKILGFGQCQKCSSDPDVLTLVI